MLNRQALSPKISSEQALHGMTSQRSGKTISLITMCVCVAFTMSRTSTDTSVAPEFSLASTPQLLAGWRGHFLAAERMAWHGVCERGGGGHRGDEGS